jgi:O-antigen biosynthesis protein
LRGAIEDMTVRFPPIEFNIPPDPQLSICVETTGSVETIYDTLRSICGFKSKIAFEVVLFDSGACDEALLLPLVARNLRYFRADEGSNPVAVRNRTAEFARGEIIVFLSGIAEPSRNWPEMIFAAFQADESLAVVGAKILRTDGVLENAGIVLTSERSEAIGSGADPSSEPFLHRRRIDAVTSAAFAVRREAWQHGLGLDESRAGVESALADFCIRTSAADGKIVYEPDFEVVLRR